ncbi:preprotein translocase subunit SecG [Campylobacter sp. MG1]|uniref:preprotein translocase subunit SecG n=1 Tax=Campylobacter sp. MG1 TaxID=2976332 RepID=UPI00226CC419|nr:preprotein translocase subunit SecG [Campylobacter sp. MG1]
MNTIFIAIQFVLVVIICACVLMQKSSSIGLGAYSGSNESLFGAKGPAGFLAKFTFIVGILLVANTIFLGYTYNTKKDVSVVDRVKAVSQTIDNKSNSTNELPSSVK